MVSGLSASIGTQLAALTFLPPPAIVLLLMLLISACTAVTSNVATSSIFLPVVASLGVEMRVHPLLFMLPVTLTCSLAFILPVSTPPNAIAFASGRIQIRDMATHGLAMTGIGVVLVFGALYGWGRGLFELGSFPEWAENFGAAAATAAR